MIMSINSQNNVRFKDLIAEFNQIRADAFSGNLVIQVTDTPSWMLCFYAGRLAGISGGIDPIARWQRNLALASLNAPLDRLIKSTDRQEIFLNSNQLAQECAVQEVLFDIIQFSQNQGDILCYQLIPVDLDRDLLRSTLPLLELQLMLSQTIKAWQEWEKHELGVYAPSLFPIVQKSDRISIFDDDRNLQYLISSIDGTKSLRSLAIHHQKKLIDVVDCLLPLLKLDIITLSPLKQSIGAQASFDEIKIAPAQQLHQRAEVYLPVTPAPSPLIACIDDSILVYKKLEKIITAHGCRSFGVQDPLRIISSLIKNKPDLIFLDLVMPVTNGYEVCEQIRKTPSLATVPIIILTGSDGFIDRVRTKFVGANGFLGKPINPEAILKTIDKYLGKSILNINVDRPKKFVRAASSITKRGSTPSSSVTQTRSGIFNNIDKQILIIDNDRNIREVISMCLQKLKCWDVLTAASAQEGLNKIHDRNPNVIIFDAMMPEMNELAFLRYLRSSATTKCIPVVLLTANRHLPDRHLLTELGVVEIVYKPFLPTDLVRQIDRALECNTCLV